MSRRGWLLFAAMCVIWGIPYLLIKVAVGEVSPVALVFLRTASGALLLVPIAAARGHLRPLLPHWRWIAAYTVIEIGIPWVLLSDAERKLSSSLAGLLVAAVPLIGTVIAAAMGHERVDGRRLTGLLVGLGGVGALLGLDVGSGSAPAVVEMGAVAVCYAVGPVIVARRLNRLPALGVVAASLALAAVAYAPVAATRLPAHMPGGSVIAALALLGVVCTALAFVVFFALIAEVGPVRATVITYVNPAVAVLLGVSLLHERFTAGIALGFALILAGCVLATRRTQVAAAPRPTSCTSQTLPSGSLNVRNEL
ncbi:MAG TPA: EamA family transporter [Candidatus Angelobacter sp.]|jgi:drug/metabolite transporter (DMT)-like permease|nr:EamA family transporter [Candidatus Angelobacter sp.]